MPALKKTEITGTIVWLGRVPHRDADEIETDGLTEMALSFAGLDGEVHAGLTRPSCSRVTAQYPHGTEIRNVRQLSILSEEEMNRIAVKLALPQLDPRWLGASVVVRGIPDFSHIPPSARLQARGGCTLTVDMQNRPCHLPAKTIDAVAEGYGKGFKEAAKGLRGVTAWVEREGNLRLGEEVALHIPDQRPWAP